MHFLELLFRLLALTSLVHVSFGKTVKKTLTVLNANLAPDGVNRSTTVVDGMLPGPVITGDIGDHFQLTVVDNLTNAEMRRATSIHWHGLFQAHSNEMDGVAFINQCPIIPDKSFLYDFTVPGQSGTYWYHSHYANQYCDGLRGVFVLYDKVLIVPNKDPQDPLKHLYDIDDESTIITIADWYHDLSTQLYPNPGENAPEPDSTLINGLGRWANHTGPPTPLAVVRAQPGKRHRYRIASLSCFPTFNFSIDGHSMTVIETDGVETQPYTVDTITVEPAQRLSVIITADKPVDNYWIRAIPVGGDGNPTTVGGVNSAILRYDGASDAEPNSTAVANPIIFNEADVIPLVNPGAAGEPYPGGADVNINLLVGKDPVTGNFTINNVAYIPPSVPILLQILSGAVDPGTAMPNGSIYYLPPNKTIEVSFPGAFPHPMHLHGHNFDVVRVAGSDVYNYENPIRRDVVSIGGPADNVTFRFVTNNPGPWILHCHIDWHLSAGLAIVFAEDAPGVLKADPPNEEYLDLCPSWNENNPDTQFPG